VKNWEGYAWDFVLSWGNFILKQRWFDYNRWSDFEGIWLPKSWYNVDDAFKQLRNPWHKFFWWYLRYGGG
jgi:hypothetical protein